MDMNDNDIVELRETLTSKAREMIT
jgi:hypothetical protein